MAFTLTHSVGSHCRTWEAPESSASQSLAEYTEPQPRLRGQTDECASVRPQLHIGLLFSMPTCEVTTDLLVKGSSAAYWHARNHALRGFRQSWAQLMSGWCCWRRERPRQLYCCANTSAAATSHRALPYFGPRTTLETTPALKLQPLAQAECRRDDCLVPGHFCVAVLSSKPPLKRSNERFIIILAGRL